MRLGLALALLGLCLAGLLVSTTRAWPSPLIPICAINCGPFEPYATRILGCHLADLDCQCRSDAYLTAMMCCMLASCGERGQQEVARVASLCFGARNVATRIERLRLTCEGTWVSVSTHVWTETPGATAPTAALPAPGITGSSIGWATVTVRPGAGSDGLPVETDLAKTNPSLPDAEDIEPHGCGPLSPTTLGLSIGLGAGIPLACGILGCIYLKAWREKQRKCTTLVRNQSALGPVGIYPELAATRDASDKRYELP